MAVLRCPYCGKQISAGSEYCNHCGGKIDKPVVDTYWSGQAEGLSIVLKIIGVIFLWMFIGIGMNALFITSNHWFVIGLTTLLTLIVVLVIKMVK